MDLQTIRNIQIQLDDVQHEMTRLRQIEERAMMKIRQLESDNLDDFGGFGTGNNKEQRQAYVRALRFAISKEIGEV